MATAIIGVGNLGSAVARHLVAGDEPVVLAALRAGARGFAAKSADPAEVLRAIRAAAVGDTVVTAAVAERLLAHAARAVS